MKWWWEAKIEVNATEEAGPSSEEEEEEEEERVKDSEKVEKVRAQLSDFQRRLEVVEQRIERRPPAASAR